MRTIVKGAECEDLRKWKRDNAASPQNIHYDNLNGEVRGAMLKQLVKEQGGLCAYTMKPIMSKDGVLHAHIEHVLPRSKHADKSVTWNNLLACVPQPGVACDYGAVRKGAYDPTEKPFVSPTRGGVAAQFRFRENGDVEGLTSAAMATLAEDVLNLKHADLVNDRRGKISGAIGRRPSAAAARQRAEQLRKPDRDGNFEPYCEAVAQVLEAYAKRLEHRAVHLSKTKRP